MTIAFIHSQASFLPELEAYHDFFGLRGVQCETFHQQQWKRNPRPVDVEWHMMGTDIVQKNASIRIHEYASASSPPLMTFKNRLKKWINTKPDYRLFLNEYVRSSFQFKDKVPFGYRDMGVDEAGPALRKAAPTIDFIYVGSIDQHRNIQSLLEKFTAGELSNRTILILSKEYKTLQQQFSLYSNIRFEGPVPHHVVREYLLQAAYAINFIPHKEPYNMQTSTKLLEYTQQQLPVISTDYPWMRAFEKKHGGRYYYLDSTLSNLRWDDVQNFPYEHADLTGMNWETRILNSGVWDFLQTQGL